MRVPYVLIELSLAASRDVPICHMCLSNPVAGRTLTSAPQSTRNCWLEAMSQTKRRPLLTARPARFPTRSKVAHIAELPLQMCDGNNTVYLEREHESSF